MWGESIDLREPPPERPEGVDDWPEPYQPDPQDEALEAWGISDEWSDFYGGRDYKNIPVEEADDD
jgi:hypothetical protein